MTFLFEKLQCNYMVNREMENNAKGFLNSADRIIGELARVCGWGTAKQKECRLHKGGSYDR